MTGETKLPICVDLDGTLIYSDTLAELFVRVLKHCPFLLFALPFWLLKGKAYLKTKLVGVSGKYLKNVPFNETLIAFLKGKKNEGHSLYLVTACEESLAKKLTVSLGIFDDVWGSSQTVNLKASHKSDFLTNKFGKNNFIYAGNDTPDLDVWKNAAEIIIVNAAKCLENKAKRENPDKNAIVFQNKTNKVKSFFKAIRIHQWTKNILIFVPLFLSHTYGDLWRIKNVILAFAAFSLCASATYILNDILDIENDRLHPTKKKRPIPAGQISMTNALLAMLFCFIAAFALTSCISLNLSLMLFLYIGLTLPYSFYLKRIVLLDVILLALLYMHRIYFGAVAISTSISFWLASFAIFIFLSLGFMKRYIELLKTEETQSIKGRGYHKDDTLVISIIGIASGILSILLYILYVDENASTLYERPIFLMFGSILLIYFITKIWIMANRGLVDCDPIIYAIKTKENYIIGALFLILFVLASPISVS